MKITITGSLGSGKSTIAKILTNKLGVKRYSVGDFMGELAMERGMTLMELSFEAEKNPKIDRILDDKQINFGKKHDNFVLDSRLGWHFIPDSFKIFLKCDIDVAAKRVFNTNREDEKENTSLGVTKKNILRRMRSEKIRYRKYYGIDPYDENNFDLVVDTTSISPDEVIGKIMANIK